MVKFELIQKSDAQLDDFFAKFDPVALFVGATNGIGRNTIKHFAKITIRSHPRVYFVGRSVERGEQLKSELTAINPNGYYEFISEDIRLMNAVDEVCRKFTDKESHLNLLYMSQGTTARQFDTADRIPIQNAVMYYSKVRFAINLSPLMRNAPGGLRRAVFTFAAGYEGLVPTDDLDGRNLSALNNRDLIASMTSLAVDKLSQEAPEISWVHNFPGFVESGIWEGLEGLGGAIFRVWTRIMGFFLYMKPEENAVRQMFLATSARFPPAKSAIDVDDGVANGVPLRDDRLPVVSINGRPGGGAYSVDYRGNTVSQSVLDRLVDYRADGKQDIVWNHTLATFQRITEHERLPIDAGGQ